MIDILQRLREKKLIKQFEELRKTFLEAEKILKEVALNYYEIIEDHDRFTLIPTYRMIFGDDNHSEEAYKVKKIYVDRVVRLADKYSKKLMEIQK